MNPSPVPVPFIVRLGRSFDARTWQIVGLFAAFALVAVPVMHLALPPVGVRRAGSNRGDLGPGQPACRPGRTAHYIAYKNLAQAAMPLRIRNRDMEP